MKKALQEVNIFSKNLVWIHSELKLSLTHTHTQKAHHNKYMYRVVDTHANDCEHTSDSSDLPSDSSLARAPFSALLLCQLKGEKVGNQSAFVCLYVCALSVLVCVCLNV